MKQIPRFVAGGEQERSTHDDGAPPSCTHGLCFVEGPRSVYVLPHMSSMGRIEHALTRIHGNVVGGTTY